MGDAAPQTRAASAARRKRRFRSSARRFPPTREGWWFLLATLLVGAAAVNAGLNLLFLVFGMMIFLILASGVMSEMNLRGLQVTRRLPGTIHAGAPFLVGIAVKNAKQRLPTFSLEVEDLVEDRPVERRCYFLKIPAGRQQETAYRHVVARRGWHRLTGFRLSTRFPFGLIRKSRDLDAAAEVLVFPKLVDVPEGWLPAPAALRPASGRAKPSRAGEFHGLREYREGEDPRHIHWRASARRGRLLLRETEDETGRDVMVVLDAHEGCDPAAFEAAVSMAASLVIRLGKLGFMVGLTIGQQARPPLDGPTSVPPMMRMLALATIEEASRGRGARAMATAFVVKARPDRPELQVIEAPNSRRSA